MFMQRIFFFLRASVVCGAVFLGASALPAVAAEGSSATKSSSSENFDPRDFTGVWMTNHRGTRGYRGMGMDGDMPARTPWGEAKFKTTITGRSSSARPGVPPANGNDPIMKCNPYGIPRLLFYTHPVEFFQVPGRLLMFFEGQRTLREIWMDGRPLPEYPEARWLGNSAGKWEGDTLVIDTVGFDDRAWLDQYGNIYSEDMHFQERWRRASKDKLEVTYRIEDPKTYTKPWVSTVKVFERQELPKFQIREEFCVPFDEDFFNENIRDRAGKGVK
jgi:hypothetical protein